MDRGSSLESGVSHSDTERDKELEREERRDRVEEIVSEMKRAEKRRRRWRAEEEEKRGEQFSPASRASSMIFLVTHDLPVPATPVRNMFDRRRPAPTHTKRQISTHQLTGRCAGVGVLGGARQPRSLGVDLRCTRTRAPHHPDRIYRWGKSEQQQPLMGSRIGR